MRRLFSRGPYRHLTPGEVDLAHSVFKDSLDYARIRLYARPFVFFQPRESAMAPNGHIYVRGEVEDDYSRAGLMRRAFFLHEITHVWQYQNRVLNPLLAGLREALRHGLRYDRAYFYRLHYGYDLLDYGLEQQASIIEDYYLQVQCGSILHTSRCLNACTASERTQLYQSVLNRFLDNPGLHMSL
jgi:hypothetical protein